MDRRRSSAEKWRLRVACVLVAAVALAFRPGVAGAQFLFQSPTMVGASSGPSEPGRAVTPVTQGRAASAIEGTKGPSGPARESAGRVISSRGSAGIRARVGAWPEALTQDLVSTEGRIESAATRSRAEDARYWSKEGYGRHSMAQSDASARFQSEAGRFSPEQKMGHGAPGVLKLHAASGMRTSSTGPDSVTAPRHSGDALASGQKGESLTAFAQTLRRVGRYGSAFRVTVENTTGRIAKLPVIVVALPSRMEFIGLSKAPEHTLTAIHQSAQGQRVEIHLPYSLLDGEIAEVTLQTRSKVAMIEPSVDVIAHCLDVR